MILLFQHGWGFDASFWQALAEQLPQWRTAFDDRGYFGAPQTPAIAEPCIVIAHSFGAMRALAKPPAQCAGLVAINAFDRFTADGEKPGVPSRIVDRMIAKFNSDPTTVLADFRGLCGDDTACPPADVERLRADLLALRDSDRTAESARWPTPILSLQGAGDPLLPAPMRSQVFAAAPLLKRLTHPTGGHLLPVTDAPYCARAIRAFVEHVG